MAIPTIPGVQHDPYPLTLSGQDLDKVFSDSFASLMGNSDSGSSASGDGLGFRMLDDDMQDDAASSATVLGGQDTISAAGDASGQSSNLSLGGTLSFLGGVGANTRSVGDNATIFGTAHSVYHYAKQGTAGQSVFQPEQSGNPLQPENILFDASSSHQSLYATAGVGDTIKGGTASDTISIHNTVDGGNGSATLSGGSGSANLFQFLNNKGGHYTIADFGKAAGNKVGLKATDEQMGRMLDNQTVKGGNVTLDLPNDQGQITFIDQKHLNPKDFQKF